MFRFVLYRRNIAVQTEPEFGAGFAVVGCYDEHAPAGYYRTRMSETRNAGLPTNICAGVYVPRVGKALAGRDATGAGSPKLRPLVGGAPGKG